MGEAELLNRVADCDSALTGGLPPGFLLSARALRMASGTTVNVALRPCTSATCWEPNIITSLTRVAFQRLSTRYCPSWRTPVARRGYIRACHAWSAERRQKFPRPARTQRRRLFGVCAAASTDTRFARSKRPPLQMPRNSVCADLATTASLLIPSVGRDCAKASPRSSLDVRARSGGRFWTTSSMKPSRASNGN